MQKEKNKICNRCKEEFKKNQNGRVKLLRKIPKGEVVIYICKICVDRMEISWK